MGSPSSTDYTAPKLRAVLLRSLLTQEADCMPLTTGGAAACGAAGLSTGRVHAARANGGPELPGSGAMISPWLFLRPLQLAPR